MCLVLSGSVPLCMAYFLLFVPFQYSFKIVLGFARYDWCLFILVSCLWFCCLVFRCVWYIRFVFFRLRCFGSFGVVTCCSIVFGCLWFVLFAFVCFCLNCFCCVCFDLLSVKLVSLCLVLSTCL